MAAILSGGDELIGFVIGRHDYIVHITQKHEGAMSWKHFLHFWKSTWIQRFSVNYRIEGN